MSGATFNNVTFGTDGVTGDISLFLVNPECACFQGSQLRLMAVSSMLNSTIATLTNRLVLVTLGLSASMVPPILLKIVPTLPDGTKYHSST